MTRKLREPVRGSVLCLVVIAGSVGAHAAPVSPTWTMRQQQPPQESFLMQGGVAPDPVLPVIESIGQASEAPRLGHAGLRIAAAPPTGGEGANEALLVGGVTSSGGSTRLLEGVSEARDPFELLPPEPTVAVTISAPLPHALLAVLLVVIAVRNRARLGRLLAA